jgi:SAM-dependent methyltransferase
MARHASGVLNQEVLHLRHEEIAFVDEFDGIWSNASLLHVPRADLPEVFGRLRRALVPGGVLFTSFKIGEGETFRSERIFTNQTAGSLRELIESVSGLELIESWVSNDLRPGREHEQWLNSLCRRSD